MFRLFLSRVIYAVVGWICYVKGLDFGKVGRGGDVFFWGGGGGGVGVGFGGVGGGGGGGGKLRRKGWFGRG